MTTLMTPHITLSGDSRETLVNDRAAVLPALREAMKLMAETKPNGRNYIGHIDVYERDREIYFERYKTLQNLHDEILYEALAIEREGD